jgi:hypothetical protein
MATTTNYGWTTPDDSQAFKLGANAIRTLGSSVDTTLATALGGAYPGLRLVKSQTIGSGVANVSVTGAFSSTYSNYLITVNGLTASAGGGTMGFLFEDAGGTALTSGNYFSTHYSTMATGTTVLAASGNNVSYLECGSLSATNINNFGFIINGPNQSTYKHLTYQSGDTSYTRQGTGYCSNTTAFTRFRLSPLAGGTLSGGAIRVYGMGIS